MESLICIVAGMAGWFLFVSARRKAARIETWPVVSARILESSVGSRREPGRPKRYTYYPVVRYAYEMDGTVYTNDKVDPIGRGSRNPAPAEETVRRYPVGTLHDLRYHPERPQEAYLQNQNSAALFAIVGSVFIGVGLLLWVLT